MLREIWENNYLKAGIGLILGLGFIIYINPPYTPCDSQKEIYDKELQGYIKPYNSQLKLCKALTGPGGCVGYFEIITKLEKSISDIGSACREKLLEDPVTKQYLTNAIEVFTRVAWGSTPPASYRERNGWLEVSQVVQFCRIKKLYNDTYGQEAYMSIVNMLLTELPQASQIGRNEVWNRSLLSDPCSYAGL